MTGGSERLVTQSNRQIVIERFITAFIENGGRILDACQQAGLKIHQVMYWQATDPEFSRIYNEAKVLSTAVLEDVAVKRATIGDEVPIMHQGKVVGTKYEKSDALMTLLLKARKPDEYGDKNKVIIQQDKSSAIIDVISQAIEDTEDVKYVPAVDGMNTTVMSDILSDIHSVEPDTTHYVKANTAVMPDSAVMPTPAPATAARRRVR